MIKIMIVDDMPIFREYLRSAIDWESYGFQICAEAPNGQEALALAKIHEPDIVLSDINMPYLDGLGLTEALRKCCPEASVVLITGHTEFEYARRAIKLGAADFIVKPFEKEELLVTLLALQDNIQRSIENAIVLSDQLYIQRERFLMRFIYANTYPLEPQVFSNQMTLWPNENYRIIVIALDSQQDDLEDFERAMSWKRSLRNMVENLIDEGDYRYSFTDDEDHMVVMIHYRSLPVETMATDDFSPLIQLVKERLNLQVTLGIGTIKPGYEGIRHSYQEAFSAIHHRFHTKLSPPVIPYATISKEEKAIGFYSSEVNEGITLALSRGQEQETLALIESVFKTCDQNSYSPDLKHMIYMGLTSLLLSYLVKAGQNLEDIFPNGFEGSKMLSLGLPDNDQRAFIVGVYRQVLHYLWQKRESRASKLATHAKAYIDDHFRDSDLNMKHLTQALFVNQTYLRSMFKAEFGMTIFDYVTQCKMEGARELLSKGDQRHAQIAEYLGYSDSSYFSKCFKRYFGVSPSDFKSSDNF